LLLLFIVVVVVIPRWRCCCYLLYVDTFVVGIWSINQYCYWYCYYSVILILLLVILLLLILLLLLLLYCYLLFIQYYCVYCYWCYYSMTISIDDYSMIDKLTDIDIRWLMILKFHWPDYCYHCCWWHWPVDDIDGIVVIDYSIVIDWYWLMTSSDEAHWPIIHWHCYSPFLLLMIPFYSPLRYGDYGICWSSDIYSLLLLMKIPLHCCWFIDLFIVVILVFVVVIRVVVVPICWFLWPWLTVVIRYCDIDVIIHDWWWYYWLFIHWYSDWWYYSYWYCVVMTIGIIIDIDPVTYDWHWPIYCYSLLMIFGIVIIGIIVDILLYYWYSIEKYCYYSVLVLLFCWHYLLYCYWYYWPSFRVDWPWPFVIHLTSIWYCCYTISILVVLCYSIDWLHCWYWHYDIVVVVIIHLLVFYIFIIIIDSIPILLFNDDCWWLLLILFWYCYCVSDYWCWPDYSVLTGIVDIVIIVVYWTVDRYVFHCLLLLFIR